MKKEKLEAKKEAKVEVLDEELPGALQPPPAPKPISPDLDHCRAEAIVVEAWQLAYRFKGVLELDMNDIPTLDAMLRFYMGSKPLTGNVCPMLMSFAEFLVMDICEHAMDIVLEGDVSMKKVDFAPPTRNAHMISWSEKNWQELLHRYLFTVAVAAVNSEHSDIHTINYPLEYVHPYHVIESMTLGPTESELLQGELNPLLSDEAESRIAARRDALALLNASIETKTSNEHLEFEMYANLDIILRGLMCQLYLISTRNGGRLVDLFFHSKEAVLAARTGVPLDFSNIGARIEASVYLRQNDPIKSFAADVFYVCQVILLATERSPDAFGTEKSISRLRETVGEILKFIRHELNKLDEMGMEKCARAYESMLSSDFSTEIISESFDTSLRKSLLAPRNLPAPPSSCFICWRQKEGEEFISCNGCGNLGHIDCLERESALGLVSCTESLPKCLICSYSSERKKQICVESFSSYSDPCTLLWAMVRKLRAEDLRSWTSDERLHLLEHISRLFAECPSIKGCLQEEEENLTKLKKKLMHARGELKALQGKEQAQDHSHRQLREAEIRKEKLVIQISRVEEDIKKIPPSRLKPVGMDRLWNRYWELPRSALNSGRASIMIERCPHEDCNLPSDAWEIGIYSSNADIDALLQWMNPKGAREKLLHQRLLSFLDNSFDNPVLDENLDENHDGSCRDEASKCSSLKNFSNELLDFETNLPRVIFHEVRGSDRAVEHWRQHAKNLESPSQAIAAVLDLESLLDLSCFKVHWRLWSIPAPDPVRASLLCTAWNRLEHLRKAVKLSSNKRYCLSSLFLEAQHGFSKGALKHHHSSDDDQEREQGLTDQQLAMKLDAELNQRRRPATPGCRVWQLSSPRDRAGRSDRNLRKIDSKFYGESDVESDKASSQRDASMGSFDEENGEEEGSLEDISEDLMSENDESEDEDF